jgi:C4-dicarboxylate transporter DctM subunit
MEGLLLFSVFFVLMLLGVPLGTALGVAGVLTIFVFSLGVPLIGPNFVAGIASFPLLAIPFFILAGVIMERAGIASRIARFFELIVGKKTGGLALVAVLMPLQLSGVSKRVSSNTSTF